MKLNRNNIRHAVPPSGGSVKPAKAGTTCLWALRTFGAAGRPVSLFALKIGAERRTPRRSAFTLVELLAAMAFMAIVIPVAMEGLQIASRAGQVGQRKAVAARVADRMLNEYVVMSANRAGVQRGKVEEGPLQFDWNIKIENWREDNMRLVTCEVSYPVQGQEYSVRTSTLLAVATR